MSQVAADAYSKKAADFLAMAEKILEAAKAAQAVPAGINWGHVGDIAHINVFLSDALVAMDPN